MKCIFPLKKIESFKKTYPTCIPSNVNTIIYIKINNKNEN